MSRQVHFIDCGANIGQSIEWAKHEYGDRLSRIDSFEPMPENYNVLMEKYSNDKLIKLHKKAVWVKNTEKIFFTQDWGSRTGSSLMIKHISGYIVMSPFTENYDIELASPPAGRHHAPDFDKDAYSKLAVEAIENNEDMKNILKQLKAAANHNGVIVKFPIESCSNGGETENLRSNVRIKVDCMNLSDWIKQNINKENYNVLKIDVESAEYELIPYLLQCGIDNYVDKWFVEFHYGTSNFDQSVITKFENTVSDWEPWIDQADRFDKRRK